jgi:hypothetical protein
MTHLSRNFFVLSLFCICGHVFSIDVTFEMRTVQRRICLFNDDLKIVGQHFYIKQKQRGREQDSGETERESVCVRERGSAWWKRRYSVSHKMSR